VARALKKNNPKRDFKSFSIKFKPAGIYQKLGIPMDNFRDESLAAS